MNVVPRRKPPFAHASSKISCRSSSEHRQRRAVRDVVGEAERRLARPRPDLRVVVLDLPVEVGVHRVVAAGDVVVGRALEDGDVRGLLRDLGDQLHAGGPGADDGDALAGEVHALVRPQPGVEPVAPEAVAARELGQVRRRQAAHGGDEEAGREALAVLGVDQPAPGVVVPGRRRRPWSGSGCRGAGRSGRRRSAGSAGSPAGPRSARSTSTPRGGPRRAGRRSCRSSSPSRTARPGSGSSTRCPRRRRPPRAPAPTSRGCPAGGGACTDRRTRLPPPGRRAHGDRWTRSRTSASSSSRRPPVRGQELPRARPPMAGVARLTLRV